MKKVVFIAVSILFLFLRNESFAQQYFGTKKFHPGSKHLVITHPTVYNLKTMITLFQKHLIELPHTELVGVFYKLEKYDYTNSENFLDTCSSLPIPIFLHKVSDTINLNSIYQKNALTDDFQQIEKNSNGVIFFGGPDMPSEAYGEKTNLLTNISDPFRHYFELSFLFHLTGGSQNSDFIPLLDNNPSYIIYGFCLGMQTMNVAAGGTLVQDIPTKIYHIKYVQDMLLLDENQTHRNYYKNLSIDPKLLSGSFHQIKIQKGNFFYKLTENNPNPLVYSNHHQCVDHLGQGYSVIAYSMDGKIIEAIHHQKFKNVIGVQFHPEAMRLYDEQIKFRRKPKARLQNGSDILKQNKSYQFHKAFWEDFEKRFNTSR